MSTVIVIALVATGISSYTVIAGIMWDLVTKKYDEPGDLLGAMFWPTLIFVIAIIRIAEFGMSISARVVARRTKLPKAKVVK